MMLTRADSPARRLWAAVLYRLSPLLEWNDLVVLHWSATQPAAPPPAAELVRFEQYSDAVVDILERMRNPLPVERVHERFGHGLQFLLLPERDRPVATTWAVLQGERFIDELALGFAADGGQIWLRDIYVEAAARGRGTFARLLDAVRAGDAARITGIGSVVHTSTVASLLAHRKYGFRVVGRYTVLTLCRLLVLRLRWKLHAPPSSAFKPWRRVLLRGPQYRRFVSERRS